MFKFFNPQQLEPTRILNALGAASAVSIQYLALSARHAMFYSDIRRTTCLTETAPDGGNNSLGSFQLLHEYSTWVL